MPPVITVGRARPYAICVHLDTSLFLVQVHAHPARRESLRIWPDRPNALNVQVDHIRASVHLHARNALVASMHYKVPSPVPNAHLAHSPSVALIDAQRALRASSPTLVPRAVLTALPHDGGLTLVFLVQLEIPVLSL